MEIGRTYYVLGLTPKDDFLSQRPMHFPVIDRNHDDRIPSDSKALQVFADHKRALECLEREMLERTREFTEEAGGEVKDFTIGHSSRQEIKDIASEEGATYVIVEERDGRSRLENVSAS